MAGRVEMRERVSVRRILATSDMTAGKADAQFIPRPALSQALLAAVGARLRILDRIEVLAAIVHVGNRQASLRVPGTGSRFCMLIPVT